MGRNLGLLFFMVADYHAVRDINRKEKVQRHALPAISEPTKKPDI